ncbi:MAG: hypothetical protein KDA24_22125 [Deltaproteobacteria bacterium]|nr:hypothetical protein [Deltaproteobacteria bacterium]
MNLRSLLLVAALALPMLPSTSEAQEAEVASETKKVMNAGLGFGWHFFQDDAVKSIYGGKGRFLTKVQVGLVPWSKYVHVEVNASISFTQFTGSAQFVSGGSSADNVMFTLFPIGVDLLVGIDIADEQPVVPYGGVGISHTIFRENETGGGTAYPGYRFGGSVFFGGAFLLDIIERSRSAELDSKSGINDAFFTIEGRYNGLQSKFESGALTPATFGLQSWQIVAGIKLVI